MMEKPQLQFEYHFQEQFPEEVERYYDWVTDGMKDVHREYLDQMMEDVYKVAFVDGFMAAMFYRDIY